MEDTEAGIELYESRTICKCMFYAPIRRSHCILLPRTVPLAYFLLFPPPNELDLASKVNSPLMPSVNDSIQYFKFDQMCTTETCHFFSSMAWLVGEYIYAEAM